MTVLRVFFAIDLSEATKKEIEIFINELKKKARSKAIRWTKPENLHITLQFLSAVNSDDLPKLIDIVRTEIAGKIKNSYVNLENLQLFPSPYRPRVIVLNITPQADLVNLAGAIGHGIQELQYPLDDRPFRGHLTIGRIKHTQGVRLNFLSNINTPVLDKIKVNEVVLFRSEPQPEGSKYTVIEKIALSGGIT
jgi:RNA 2',3'-cyclic 3'-phosphodiesterase